MANARQLRAIVGEDFVRPSAVQISYSTHSLGWRTGFSCRLSDDGNSYMGRTDLWNNDLHVEEIETVVESSLLVSELTKLGSARLDAGAYSPTKERGVSCCGVANREVVLSYAKGDVKVYSESHEDVAGAAWGLTVAGSDWKSCFPGFFSFFECVRDAGHITEWYGLLDAEHSRCVNARMDAPTKTWVTERRNVALSCSALADVLSNSLAASQRFLPRVCALLGKNARPVNNLSAYVDEVVNNVSSIHARLLACPTPDDTVYRFKSAQDEDMFFNDLGALGESVSKLTGLVRGKHLTVDERKQLAIACVPLRNLEPVLAKDALSAASSAGNALNGAQLVASTASSVLIGGQPVITDDSLLLDVEPMLQKLAAHC